MTKTSMGKLGESELLKELHSFYMSAEYFYNRGIAKQAYAQLVEIVEQHFLDPGVKTEILAQEYEKGLQDGYEHAGKPDPGTQEGVDEEKIRFDIPTCHHAYKMLDKAENLWCDDCVIRAIDMVAEQLLSHLPTSGNDMSDKQAVTLCEIHEFCHNLLDEFEIDREDLIEIEAELAQWLKELGIEVK